MPNIYKSQPALVYPDVESLVEDILPVTPLNDAVPTETPMVRASHKSFIVPVESPETAGVGENSIISNASLVETPVVYKFSRQKGKDIEVRRCGHVL